MKEVIKVEKLTKNYYMDESNGEKIPVLKEVTFCIQEGEFVAIMGRSGCGKSTMLRILGMMDRPTSGQIYFKEKNTKDLWDEELADIRRRQIGFVFQDFYLLDSLSVEENMMLPLILDKVPIEECKSRMQKLAKQFGIAHLLKKKPYELSGGEKQRTAIGRALINDPDMILADEPTGNLDSKSGEIVVDVFRDIHERLGKTIVMVTHDPKVASQCKRVLFVKDGVIMNDIPREEGETSFYEKILSTMKEF